MRYVFDACPMCVYAHLRLRYSVGPLRANLLVHTAQTYFRHLLFKTAASTQISLNEDSTPKLSPHLSKNRQRTVLARIQPHFIFHTLLLFSYPTSRRFEVVWQLVVVFTTRNARAHTQLVFAPDTKPLVCLRLKPSRSELAPSSRGRGIFSFGYSVLPQDTYL